jgi:hypothetical protein
MRHSSRSSLWSYRSVPWRLQCWTRNNQWLKILWKHAHPRHPRGHTTTSMMPAPKTCHGNIVLRFKIKFKLGSFVIDRTSNKCA